MSFVPTIGSKSNNDFDPAKKQYNVLLLSKTMLLQKGGAYIEKFVPPTVRLRDGGEFVLAAHAISDFFGVQPSGLAVVPAEDSGSPRLPSYPTSTQFEQERSYPLVFEESLVPVGLVKDIGSFPCITLSPTDDGPTVRLYAISPTEVASKKIATAGSFVVPLPNPLGPYPLRFPPKFENNGAPGMSARELFAIPPKPAKTEDGLELMTATQENVRSILTSPLVSSVVLALLITAYITSNN